MKKVRITGSDGRAISHEDLLDLELPVAATDGVYCFVPEGTGLRCALGELDRLCNDGSRLDASVLIAALDAIAAAFQSRGEQVYPFIDATCLDRLRQLDSDGILDIRISIEPVTSDSQPPAGYSVKGFRFVADGVPVDRQRLLGLQVRVVKSGTVWMAATDDPAGRLLTVANLSQVASADHTIHPSALVLILRAIQADYRERNIPDVFPYISRDAIDHLQASKSDGILEIRVTDSRQPSTQPDADVAGQDVGPPMTVRAIRFLHQEARPLADQELWAVQVRLFQNGSTWMAARKGHLGHDVPLRAIGQTAESNWQLDSSALTQILRGIADAYEQRGQGPVLLTITQPTIDKLRLPDSDGVLEIQIADSRAATAQPPPPPPPPPSSVLRIKGLRFQNQISSPIADEEIWQLELELVNRDRVWHTAQQTEPGQAILLRDLVAAADQHRVHVSALASVLRRIAHLYQQQQERAVFPYVTQDSLRQLESPSSDGVLDIFISSQPVAMGMAVRDTPLSTNFKVTRFHFDGLSGKGLSDSELLALSVKLQPVANVLTAPLSESAAVSMTLSEIAKRGSEGYLLSLSGMDLVLKQISHAYQERRIAAVRAEMTSDTLDSMAANKADGVAAIRIVEGKVGQLGIRLRSRNGEVFDDPPVADDAGQYSWILTQSPLRPGDLVDLDAVDDYLAWMNRSRDRRISVALEPGEQNDQLRLNYLVDESKPLQMYAQTSNTGTQQTGLWRAGFGLRKWNVTNNDDVLDLNYVTSYDNNVYAVNATYDQPLDFLPRARGRLRADLYEFDASQFAASSALFHGEGYTLAAEVSQNVWQDRDFLSLPLGDLFLDTVVGFEFQRAKVVNELALAESRAPFVLPYFGFKFDQLSESVRTTGSLLCDYSIPGLTSRRALTVLGRTLPDDEWWRLRFQLEHSRFLENGLASFGRFNGRAELFASFRGQIVLNSQRVVPNFTQTVGGLYNVRGYPQSFAAGDNAYIGTIEYRMHFDSSIPISSCQCIHCCDCHADVWSRCTRQIPGKLIVRGFLDFGQANRNQRLAFETASTLASTGFGWDWHLGSHVLLRGDLGWALHDVNNGEDAVFVGDHETHLSLIFFW